MTHPENPNSALCSNGALCKLHGEDPERLGKAVLELVARVKGGDPMRRLVIGQGVDIVILPYSKEIRDDLDDLIHGPP